MSTSTSRPEYADLLARVLPSVIPSEKENERFYLAMLEELDRKTNFLRQNSAWPNY